MSQFFFRTEADRAAFIASTDARIAELDKWIAEAKASVAANPVLGAIFDSSAANEAVKATLLAERSEALAAPLIDGAN